MDLITLLDGQHDTRVFILNANFGEFNSAIAKSYFAPKKIK